MSRGRDMVRLVLEKQNAANGSLKLLQPQNTIQKQDEVQNINFVIEEYPTNHLSLPGPSKVIPEMIAVLTESDVDDDIRDPDFEYHDTENSTSDSEEDLVDKKQKQKRLTDITNIAIASNISSSSNDSSNNNHQNDMVKSQKSGKPTKGRKRKFPSQTETSRKKNKNLNEVYFNKAGRKVMPRQFIEYICNCKEECFVKMPIDIRKVFFEKFWQAGCYERQNSFISACVTQSNVKRRRHANPSIRRDFTRTYAIENVTVCRNMFVKTLAISTKRVDTALKKFRNLDIKDHRGAHKNHKTLPDAKINEVMEQINRLPRYKSHYRRGVTDKEFLPSYMTVEFIYNLYKEDVENPVSLSKYKNIFYTKFNLTRKPLKKDTCNKCDVYSNTSENNPQVKEEHDIHLNAAENARNRMNSDIQEAKNSRDLETLTFDLEKTLPLPRIPTNIIFYKRQLWLYNLGIHSGKTNKGYCYVWTEGMAGRGAQEVGSCLKKFIEMYLEKNITELRLWSDSCGGQNRNIKICLLLKFILQQHPTLKVISMRFLESGHSFLPNDADFSDIEKSLKYQQRLYVPQDYINVIKSCRKKNPFTVTIMDTTDFKSTENLEKAIINRKTSNDGNKINWLLTKEIELRRDHPYSLFLKTSHSLEESFKEIDLKPKHNLKKYPSNFPESLALLWPEGKAISAPKLKDMQSILHLIPVSEQEFYTKLLSNDNVVDDIDGFNAEVDFEFENND